MNCIIEKDGIMYRRLSIPDVIGHSVKKAVK